MPTDQTLTPAPEGTLAWIVLNPKGEPQYQTCAVDYDAAMYKCFGRRERDRHPRDWWQHNLDAGWTCRAISLDPAPSDPTPIAPAPTLEEMAEALWETSRRRTFGTSWVAMTAMKGAAAAAAEDVLAPYRTQAAAILARLKHPPPVDTHVLSRETGRTIAVERGGGSFRRGDLVRKTGGDHGYTARISTRWTTLGGLERYVVEIPQERGALLHIVNSGQLKMVTPARSGAEGEG